MASVLRVGGVHRVSYPWLCAGDYFIGTVFGVRPYRQLALQTAV